MHAAGSLVLRESTGKLIWPLYPDGVYLMICWKYRLASSSSSLPFSTM